MLGHETSQIVVLLSTFVSVHLGLGDVGLVDVIMPPVPSAAMQMLVVGQVTDVIHEPGATSERDHVGAVELTLVEIVIAPPASPAKHTWLVGHVTESIALLRLICCTVHGPLGPLDRMA